MIHVGLLGFLNHASSRTRLDKLQILQKPFKENSDSSGLEYPRNKILS